MPDNGHIVQSEHLLTNVDDDVYQNYDNDSENSFINESDDCQNDNYECENSFTNESFGCQNDDHDESVSFINVSDVNEPENSFINKDSCDGNFKGQSGEMIWDRPSYQQERNANPILETRIYEGSHILVRNSSFLILGFMERYNLSVDCREELLKLLQYHLPLDNRVAKTINKLNLSLGLEQTKVHKKKYCQTCRLEVIYGPSNKNDLFCSCENFGNDFDHFLFMDVFHQISFLVEKYIDKIDKFLNEPKDYLDLTDGDYYKSIKKQNKLHVVIYSDGTPIRKSTKKKQFWPVILGLVELPLALRESIKNKVICGVWFGKKKPSSDILFDAITNELSQH